MSAPVIDWTDPCARAGALSQAYYGLLNGGQATKVRIRSGDGEREVGYAARDLDRLKAEMVEAQRACDFKTTGRPFRHAIQGV